MARILQSPEFVGSARMQDFLSYVVHEAIEGRGDQIRAKTIAQDIYRRSVASDGDSENVVRVDARRLRRKLDKYYATDGLNDAIRIHIDSGGYAPRFEILNVNEAELEASGFNEARNDGVPRTILAALVIVFGVIAVLTAVFWMTSEPTETSKVQNQQEAQRLALREKSYKALQAANYAEEARDLLFPLFDFNRQKQSLTMFRQVIKLDPESFAGYAGAAQSLATLALLSPQNPDKEAFLQDARLMADIAVSKDPTKAWSLSSAAWVAFAEGNEDKAIRLSQKSIALAPRDGHVHDYFGLIALFTGDFPSALDALRPEREFDQPSDRLGRKNVYAAASFHSGLYQQTLNLFDEVAMSGGPISPPRLAYKAAALDALGKTEAAREQVLDLLETWPNARVDQVLLNFFRDPLHANDVNDRLRKLGWTAEN
ncbi:hypothetical protein [Shimia sp.]|uniref:tetratricopeptide repeat protein n=1 Tax=Shimia sp. TaxID=1954381 RepID=UPI0032975C53